MRSIDEIYDIRWLKPYDIEPNGRMKLRISLVDIESFDEPNGNAKNKVTLAFEGMKKGLVVSRPNAEILGRAYGKDPETWKGKEVTLVRKEGRIYGQTREYIVVFPEDG